MQLLEFRREGVIEHPRPTERLISSVLDAYFKTMLKQTPSRLGAHLASALLVALAQGRPRTRRRRSPRQQEGGNRPLMLKQRLCSH